MPAPELTVGIVSWNAADDLAACLPALPAAAGDLRLQVVVVDNGSTDRTEEVLAAHPWVEAVRSPVNAGLTPGRNMVLDRVRGEFVCMLDADTVPQPGSLAALVGYLREHAEVGLAGPKLLNPDGTLQLSCRRFPSVILPFLRRGRMGRVFEHRRTVNRHLMREFDHASARPVDWVMGAAQCYRAALLPGIGRYDERIFSHGGEDTDWCVRVWRAGAEVHYVPEARVIHAYGHYTRRNPLSKQAVRAITDYLYMQLKHSVGRRRYAA